MNQKQKKMTTVNIILLITTILTALITGLFYGYSCSVNLGLGRLPDGEYLAAMQSINKEILNPYFFISFAGTLFILPIATWQSKSHASSASFYLLLAATVCYIAGVIGVTAFGNIPLNNSLAKFNVLSADTTNLSQQRAAFESGWNKFHLVRTIFSILTTALAIAAAIKK